MEDNNQELFSGLMDFLFAEGSVIIFFIISLYDYTVTKIAINNKLNKTFKNAFQFKISNSRPLKCFQFADNLHKLLTVTLSRDNKNIYINKVLKLGLL